MDSNYALMFNAVLERIAVALEKNGELNDKFLELQQHNAYHNKLNTDYNSHYYTAWLERGIEMEKKETVVD